MTRSSKTHSHWLPLIMATALLGWLSFVPATVQAQAGANAVEGATAIVASSEYIDASAYDTSATDDICTKINNSIKSIGTSPNFGGTVVDARGISTNLSCVTSGITPWTGTSKVATVLLPAGTITIANSWAIPSECQIVGEGPGLTTLLVGSALTDPYASTFGITVNPGMIHMGIPSSSSSGTGPIAFDVRISHLTLDGNGEKTVGGAYFDGIDNNNAEEQSYVDDVTIQNIFANGMYFSTDPNGTQDGAADHSGPYTNIVFQQTLSSPPAVSTTVCVDILPQIEPRGIHGITCRAVSAVTANTAILLDGNNTTIEDAHIDGFVDGILIGSAGGGAQSDLIFNVTGTSAVSNLIVIDKPVSGTPPNNVVIMDVAGSSSDTINDELTTTTLTNSSDPQVGMYIVGHPIAGASVTGYSRFTTSPRFPTWIVGPSTPGTGSCATGSLFSSISTSSTAGTLWACVGTNWPATAIK
jgi:hypothetical protein